MKKAERHLHKFTNYETGDAVYIDMAEVAAMDVRAILPTYHDPNGQYVSVSSHASHIDQRPKGVCITLKSGVRFFLVEHPGETIAVIEGRDPTPAKVLFAKR